MAPDPAVAGRRLRPDASLRRRHRGRVLTGGSPTRIFRLTEAGADLVERWRQGERVGSNRAESALAARLVDAALFHPVAEPVPLDDITVVVPVRDDPAGLERLLAGLERSVPVVVSDDGSADAAAVAATAARHGAALATRPGGGADRAAGLGGRGPGAARNAGLAEVTTGVVAFVDADATVTPEALAVLAGHLADPAVAAAAPRVRSRMIEPPGRADLGEPPADAPRIGFRAVGADSDRPGLLAAYESVYSPLDLGPEPSPVGPGRRVRYVPAAALMVRTAAARAVGGFDAALAWGEDVDFVWRLSAVGHVVRYDPDAVAWHRPRPSWPAWFEQRHRYGGSAPELARRHGRAVAAARCSPWSLGVWGAAAAGHPLIAAALAAASSAGLARRLRSRSVPGWGLLAVELTGRSHLRAGAGLARALVRAWWPLAAVGLGLGPRARRAVAAAVVAPALADWIRRPKPTGPAAAVGLRVTDDLAYGLGLWEALLFGRRTRGNGADASISSSGLGLIGRLGRWTRGSGADAARLSTGAVGLDLAWTDRPGPSAVTGPDSIGAFGIGAATVGGP